MRFTDRHEAGLLLAQRLLLLKMERPVVLALPRGGVPVGFEIARALAAPLDLVLVRKIGAPQQPELAVGGIPGGGQGGGAGGDRALRKPIHHASVPRRHRRYSGNADGVTARTLLT